MLKINCYLLLKKIQMEKLRHQEIDFAGSLCENSRPSLCVEDFMVYEILSGFAQEYPYHRP